MYGSEKHEFCSIGVDFLSKLYHWLKVWKDIQKNFCLLEIYCHHHCDDVGHLGSHIAAK